MLKNHCGTFFLVSFFLIFFNKWGKLNQRMFFVVALCGFHRFLGSAWRLNVYY